MDDERGSPPSAAAGKDGNTSDALPHARRGMSWRGWLTIAACAVYILSPFDLAPEALLGPLGLPDDLIAVLVAAKVGWSSRKRSDTGK